MLCGGEYRPVLLIVPDVDDPPTTPSTDQVTLPLAVNCCVMLNVNTEALGVTPNPVPVPNKAIVCGLKVTLIVQVPFTARVDPQLFVWAKSPVLPSKIAIELIVNGADPRFDKVTGCGLLLFPFITLPKLMLVVLRLTTGVVLPDGVRKATTCMIHWPPLVGAVAL